MSALNLWAMNGDSKSVFTDRHIEIHGDDLVSLSTKGEIQSYSVRLSKTGMLVNDTKSYQSSAIYESGKLRGGRGVFCERYGTPYLSVSKVMRLVCTMLHCDFKPTISLRELTGQRASYSFGTNFAVKKPSKMERLEGSSLTPYAVIDGARKCAPTHLRSIAGIYFKGKMQISRTNCNLLRRQCLTASQAINILENSSPLGTPSSANAKLFSKLVTSSRAKMLQAVNLPVSDASVEVWEADKFLVAHANRAYQVINREPLARKVPKPRDVFAYLAKLTKSVSLERVNHYLARCPMPFGNTRLRRVRKLTPKMDRKIGRWLYANYHDTSKIPLDCLLDAARAVGVPDFYNLAGECVPFALRTLHFKQSIDPLTGLRRGATKSSD